MAARRPVDVVFVHGLFSSARAWARLKQLLSTDPELSGFLTLHCFDYDSPLFRLRPDRRIAEIDDIADRLRTYLLAQLRNARSVVLVTHSQGGLVVQRFLARTLSRGQGGELARISRVVMYSCPNSGSDFFLSVRRWALWWSNPQEQQLRPFVRAVTETQEAVLRAVVNAQGRTDTECRIPIAAYGGISDRIVPPIVSTWVFPVNGIVEGDHFSVIRPDSRQASSYLVLRAALLDAADHGTDPGGPPETASVDRQGRVSVSPPFGRRDGRLYGRATLITSVMSPGQRSRVHILAGLGGSGKSWLALEIAQRAVQAGRRVWWVPVPLVTSCMREVAYQLSAPDTQVERAWLAGSATDLVWRCLNASSEPWLLVFDNADDPKSLGPINGVVSDGTGWLREPETSNGMVIVTSRNRNPA
ncbi:MAG TPA: alpha/beta fold hydrolase, partial [Micromonosporaceae bacterium]|nr:alpha/beta fold hydrolase [Micromonosporaceae bacterium]